MAHRREAETTARAGLALASRLTALHVELETLASSSGGTIDGSVTPKPKSRSVAEARFWGCHEEGPTVGGSPAALVGRNEDIVFIGGFVDEAAVRGGSLLVFGDAGVGKTALLDVAALHAEAAGTRVVRAIGAEFEAELSFSGLNTVLYPLLDGLASLPPLHRRALSVALGLDAGAPSDRLVLSNAVLGLLRDAAASGPLLVVVDDLPWLDRASSLVLASAVRRLAGTRVGFLAAMRTEAASFRSGWTAQLRARAARRCGGDLASGATVPSVGAARTPTGEVHELPAGKSELTPEMVPDSIQLVGPEGPRPLANLTIVRAVGCLSAAANDAWALVQASSPRPVRARIVDGTTPEELKASAAQALGTQTFPLMSVTPQRASLAGHQGAGEGAAVGQAEDGRADRTSCRSTLWARRVEGERMRAFLVSFFAGMAVSSRHPRSRRNADPGWGRVLRSGPGFGGQSRDPAANSCHEQSLRWSVETGRRRDSRCEGSDRAGPQRRQRRPFRVTSPTSRRAWASRLPGPGQRRPFRAKLPTPDEARAAMTCTTRTGDSFAVEAARRHRHASDVWRGQPPFGSRTRCGDSLSPITG